MGILLKSCDFLSRSAKTQRFQHPEQAHCLVQKELGLDDSTGSFRKTCPCDFIREVGPCNSDTNPFHLIAGRVHILYMPKLGVQQETLTAIGGEFVRDNDTRPSGPRRRASDLGSR